MEKRSATLYGKTTTQFNSVQLHPRKTKPFFARQLEGLYKPYLQLGKH